MEKSNTIMDAYILAGGKSSRMGSDKGLLNFRGKQLIKWSIDQIKPCFKNITIVSNNPDYQEFGLPVIPDLIKEKGPAGGIYTALRHTNAERIFIVACDMPFISTKAIQYLIENSADSQITVAEHETRLQPLFGVYAKECLPIWTNLIVDEKLKLQEMITNFSLLKLKLPQYNLANDSQFFNINNEHDFQEALKQVEHGN